MGLGSVISSAVFSTVLIISTALTASTRAYGISDREEAAHSAVVFSSLHFFAEGKGMHMSSDLIDMGPGASYKKSGSLVVDRFREKFSEIAADRWGLVFNRLSPAGMFQVTYKDVEVGVLG